MGFFDGLGTSLIGGLFGLGSGLLNSSSQQKAQQSANETNLRIADELNATNIQLQREANQANKELAMLQNDWNVEQWNRENEYNSPAHQVELLKAAGLNPNLVNGTASFNPASSVSSAELANQGAAHVDAQADVKPAPYDVKGVFDSAVQGAIQAREMSRIEADTEKARYEARYYRDNMPDVAASQIAANQGSALASLANAHSVLNFLPYQQNESDSRAALNDAERYNVKAQEKVAVQEAEKVRQDGIRTMIQNKYVDAQEAQRLQNLFIDELLGRANAYNANQLAELNGALASAKKIELKRLPMMQEYQLRSLIRDWKNSVQSGMYAQWKNKFIKRFGFDPSHGMWDAMYQRSLQGKLQLKDWTVPAARGTGDAVGGILRNLPFGAGLFKIGSKIMNPVSPTGFSIGPDPAVPKFTPTPEIMY